MHGHLSLWIRTLNIALDIFLVNNITDKLAGG